MKTANILIAIFVLCFLQTKNTSAQIQEQEPPYAYASSDLVDGRINLEKILATFEQLEYLEFTTEQMAQLREMRTSYFKRKNELSADPGRRGLMPEALDKEFNKVLLPHQRDFMTMTTYLKFIRTNKLSKPQKQSLLQVLGLSEETGKELLDGLKQAIEEREKELRKIVFAEIELAISKLGSAQQLKCKQALGLEDKRADLLEFKNISALIHQRQAWLKDKKPKKHYVQPRTKRSFLTSREIAWFDFTSEQRDQFTKVLGETRDDAGRILVPELSGNGHSEKTVATVSKILLPHQVEELNRLDQWRILNKYLFVEAIQAPGLGGKIGFDKAQLKGYEQEFDKVVRKSLADLSELRDKQSKELLKSLPEEWREKLDSVVAEEERNSKFNKANSKN